MIKICISGLGKTGKEIAKVLLEQKNMEIVSAVCSPASEKKGKDLGDIVGASKTGVIISSSSNIMEIVHCTKPDIVIDFTSPAASLNNAEIFSALGVNILVGTTGFTAADLKKLMLMASKNNAGILYAPNITTGVNVMMLLTNLASSILNEYDFQITEVHHKLKKDSPSGTAKKIAVEIEKGLISSGVSAMAADIPINSVRAGGVVGKHEVMMVSEFDKIEISHESFSRKAFALGAIKGIRFLAGRKGYYEMSDVLNLKKVLKDYIAGENATDRKTLRFSEIGRKEKIV